MSKNGVEPSLSCGLFTLTTNSLSRISGGNDGMRQLTTVLREYWMFENHAQNKQYYLFLDGWRGIATLWILFHHIDLFFAPSFLPSWVKKIAAITLGTDIFFVMSGFLITGLLIGDLGAGIRVKRFYIRRFFKIIPQYLFLVVVTLAAYYLIKPFSVNGFQTHIPNPPITGYFFFVQNYAHEQMPLLAHTWSLCIVEHFYIFLPLLLCLIWTLCTDAQKRRGWLIAVFVLLIVGFNIIRYYDFRTPFFPGLINVGVPFQTTHQRADALICGCLLKVLEPYLGRLTMRSWRYLLPFLTVFALLIYVFFAYHGFDRNRWYSYTLAYLAPAALLIVTHKRYGLLSTFIEGNYLRWIGKNSYGIYLWHYPTIFFVARIIGPQASTFQEVLAIGLYLLLAFLIGTGMTKTIERCFLSIRAVVAP
jgi:peptidoglycan/LPS O-acetylase OafA/YrhL